MISIDEFKNIEIKVGTILSAREVEGADKLLLLSVDMNEDNPRQIVSGIRERFPNPDELIGRQVAFVANLEPRTIRGYESQGMILACADDNNFALLVPHTPVSPGTKAR